jgi:hypothetical protein
MSEDGFNRQLKMAISLLNHWRDFLKNSNNLFQIKGANTCQPIFIAYLHQTSSGNKSFCFLNYWRGVGSPNTLM